MTEEENKQLEDIASRLKYSIIEMRDYVTYDDYRKILSIIEAEIKEHKILWKEILEGEKE